MLPDPADAIAGPPLRAYFLDILQSGDDGNAVVADADAFMKSLTAEEWNKLKAEYNKAGRDRD